MFALKRRDDDGNEEIVETCPDPHYLKAAREITYKKDTREYWVEDLNGPRQEST